MRRAVVTGLAAMAACSSGSDDEAESDTSTSSTAPTSDNTTSDDTAAEAEGGELLALSYNVAGLPDILSGSNPEANTELIGPLLDGYDLVLLQESWKSPEPNPLAPTRVYHEILEETASHEHRSEMAPLPLGTTPTDPRDCWPTAWASSPASRCPT